MRQRREKGGATMLLVLVLILAVAVLGTLAIRGATSDLGLIGMQSRGKSSFYCAEAGLNAARPFFSNNVQNWNAMFNANQGGAAVAGYPFTLDVDGDGTADVSVIIKDDYDEFPPAVNNPLLDNNLTAVMEATCNSVKVGGGINHKLQSIVVYTGQNGNDYRYQAGHSSSHSGNEN